MHNRSIEFAKKFGVPIHVRSSFSDAGTMIVAEPESARQPVCGAAVTKNEARITVLGVPDRPGVSLEIFSRVRPAERDGRHDRAERQRSGARGHLVHRAAGRTADHAGGGPGGNRLAGRRRITHDDSVSKVSVVGPGDGHQTGVAEKMFARWRGEDQHPDDHHERDQDLGPRQSRSGVGLRTHTGVAIRMFKALAEAGINLEMINTSEVRVNVVVEGVAGEKGLKQLQTAFADVMR
jgi:aspartate kinase